jgi:serine/threonine-protein kinase ATR
MREQREALMSVLTTFVHDPLIEWNKRSRITSSRGRTTNAENELNEASNKTALENLDRIRYRLNGLIGLDIKKDEPLTLNKSALNKSILDQSVNNNKIPISVNYQVSYLIEEAVSLERLCRMYVGWGSYY